MALDDLLKHMGQGAPLATKSKPSYPYLTDEYEPTDKNLWELVLEVASGKRLQFQRGDRIIHSPNGTRGYRNMPHNPKGIAWAVKQYKGFGGNWRGRKEASWNLRLRRLAAGGIEITQGPSTETARRLEAAGHLRLANVVGEKHYWELTGEGHRVVLARLTDELEKRVDHLLQSFDSKESKVLGDWIEGNFRIQSPKTPKGGKEVKDLLQRFVWVLKHRYDFSSDPDPSAVVAELKQDWDKIQPQLSLVTKFTDEGRTTVPPELQLNGVTYFNEVGVNEVQLAKYAKRIDQALKDLRGWRKKALGGGLKVVLKAPRDFRGTVTGKYISSGDALWIRTTPAVLKRAPGYAGFEHILMHELGHRYEAHHRLPMDFDKPEWWTSKYSRQEGESFAELFALSNFNLTGQWDSQILERFDRVMTGQESDSV